MPCDRLSRRSELSGRWLRECQAAASLPDLLASLALCQDTSFNLVLTSQGLVGLENGIDSWPLIWGFDLT